MCMVTPKKINRSIFRFYLTHDPNCTKTAMKNLNAQEWFHNLGFHVHECEEKPDLTEPFGAILWHKRVDTGYPLCISSALLGISTENLIRLEMGWALPGKRALEDILAGMSFYYGFNPLEYFRLVQIGEDYRKQKPIDLSEYLGLTLGEDTLNLMPQKLKKLYPCEYTRSKIQVVGKILGSGIEFPQCVIWTDGRRFPIDKIDCARERAFFKTGGVGTCFSCWVQGKQRNIGYEHPGEWFVETPCYA